MKTEMNTEMVINNNLIQDVMGAYINQGGSYFDVEDVEDFINEVMISGLSYDNVNELISLVVDEMLISE
jgi:hypothetical protein